MKLKKANAALGLLAILLLIAHAGYQVVAYTIFYYNPVVTKVLAWTFAGIVALHAVLGMSIVMFANEGNDLRKYRRHNRRTILQRASAIGILVLLVLHIQCYPLLRSGTAGLVAAEIVQFLFFACIFTHVSTSFTNALVTLGLLSDMDKKERIDKALWVICGAAFAVCVFVIGKTYIALAGMPE